MLGGVKKGLVVSAVVGRPSAWVSRPEGAFFSLSLLERKAFRVGVAARAGCCVMPFSIERFLMAVMQHAALRAAPKIAPLAVFEIGNSPVSMSLFTALL